MNDQERRAAKVEARDRALRAIRQADAFLVVTIKDEIPIADVWTNDADEISLFTTALYKTYFVRHAAEQKP